MNMFLLLGIFAGGVLYFLIEKSETQKRLAAFGGMTVCLVLFITLRLTSGGAEGTKHLVRFDEAAAFSLGEAAIKNLQSGDQAAVILPSTEYANERTLRFIESVRAGLKKASEGKGITFVESNAEGRPQNKGYMPAPLGVYDAVLEEFPDAQAILSFIGLPAEYPGTCEHFPPIYAYEYLMNQMLQNWLTEGVAQGLVVHKKKYDRAARPSGSQSLKEVFDIRYKLVLSNY